MRFPVLMTRYFMGQIAETVTVNDEIGWLRLLRIGFVTIGPCDD